MDWTSLTSMPEKQHAYSGDLYLRECWADMSEILGENLPSVLRSIALLNLKPDAVVGRRMRNILSFLVDHGFVPITAVPIQFTRHSMRELWRYDWNVYPVERLALSTIWYTATEILLFVVQDPRAIDSLAAANRLSGLKGHCIAENRRSTDLRTILCPPNRVLNFVHVAEEPIDIIRELGILLDRNERRSLLMEIKARGRVDSYDTILKQIDRLERLYPEHDLDVSASLNRLEGSSRERAVAIDYLRKVISDGKKIGWNDLCSKIDPLSHDIDRWDFISVATNVIPIEREIPKLDVPTDGAGLRLQ